jgi:outer membrane autotransporter protein
VPELQVGWRHQYDNSLSATNAHFVGDPSGETAFTSLGPRSTSDLAMITAGVTLVRANNLSVTARYELQAGGGLVAQTGALWVRLLF